MKSGQRATKADTGGQRLPEPPKDKSASTSRNASQAQKNGSSNGGQSKPSQKKQPDAAGSL